MIRFESGTACFCVSLACWVCLKPALKTLAARYRVLLVICVATGQEKTACGRLRRFWGGVMDGVVIGRCCPGQSCRVFHLQCSAQTIIDDFQQVDKVVAANEVHPIYQSAR